LPETQLKVELLRHTPKPEENIVMAAKLCYSSSSIDELKNKIEEKDQTNFLNKLISINHHSVLEHSTFTFGVEGVSRSLLSQITRHRIASYSVKSQRYVNEEGFNFIIPKRIKMLDAYNNTNLYSEKFCNQMYLINDFYNYWIKEFSKMSFTTKEEANEDARFVLPNACETKFILTMNARELLHFFKLRCCNRAQWEIRALAWEMLRLVSTQAPTLFENAGPDCIAGTCLEGSMSCGNPYTKGELVKYR